MERAPPRSCRMGTWGGQTPPMSRLGGSRDPKHPLRLHGGDPKPPRVPLGGVPKPLKVTRGGSQGPKSPPPRAVWDGPKAPQGPSRPLKAPRGHTGGGPKAPKPLRVMWGGPKPPLGSREGGSPPPRLPRLAPPHLSPARTCARPAARTLTNRGRGLGTGGGACGAQRRAPVAWGPYGAL